MAYTKFKSEIETAKYFGLSLKQQNLFPNVQLIEPTANLVDTLGFGQTYAPASEKARNELLVTPILMELIRYHAPNCSVVSGAELNVDSEKGLNGFVDFILCQAPNVYYLESPLVAIVEAKKADIEQGIGQAIAEMVAIKLFNEKNGLELHKSYGCVTNGEIWRFLSLTNQDVFFDENRYYINQLPLLLGVWKQILTQ